MGKYFSIKGTPTYILAQRIFYVEYTEVVPGTELNSNWQGDMQRVFTNKGIFIDNVTNPKHPSIPPGLDWISVIGKEVDNIYINHSKGYNWINKR